MKLKHYPHHIGDFDRATRHLTRLERSVYRDLLDLYYDTESHISLDLAHVCRKIVARTNDESTAVEQVLNEFFTKTPTGWYHDRCEAEIDAYRANCSQKALAGKASAEAKRLKREQALNGVSTAVEQPLPAVATESNGASTNHQPSTINHQPVKRERASPTGSRLPADWALPDDWAIWAKQERPDLNPNATAERFADYWHGVAGAKGRKADWQATWRNWVRAEKKQPVGASNGLQTGFTSFAQQAADVARLTVPGKQGKDAALLQIEADRAKAAPIPERVREQLAALKSGVLQ